MGEARRRSEKGLPPKQVKTAKDSSSKQFFSFFQITEKKREQFFDITKKGAWIGIFILIIFWIIVRFIGPSAGWWIPADAR